jgi:glycosyltransferase involved in cell wall biosynthesis
VSEAAAGYLSTDYRRAARVVPPGVHWAKHSAGRASPRPTLLYAGSLSESRKGVGLLLAAAELLRQEIPDLQVWLLGPGTPSEGTASDLVTRCELVEDATLREAYARAWVTVLPSVAESFGMTVVESLASGTPVVVRADSGGPAEIVDSPRIGRRAGTTAADLAAACREALDLALQPDTVQACRDSARRYDWDEAIVPALLKIYQS